MDIQSAASSLREQLISLQHSDHIENVLDREVTNLSEQCLVSDIEDNQSRHLRLLLRLSITDGVHKMYQQYSTNKWAQVQSTALSIKSQMETHTGETDVSMTTMSQMRQQPDRAVDQWSTVFCELSRDE